MRSGVGGSAGGAQACAAPLIPAQQCAQSALDRTTYLLRCGALPHPGGKYLTGVSVSAVARGGPTTMTVARRSVGRRPRAVFRVQTARDPVPLTCGVRGEADDEATAAQLGLH